VAGKERDAWMALSILIAMAWIGGALFIWLPL
jgi:hypothetical protein